MRKPIDPDQPQFQHDCRDCVFLGHRAGCDVYVCEGRHTKFSKNAVLVARYDNAPMAYTTAIIALIEARLARGGNGPGEPAIETAYACYKEYV
jgi:hypothetical protein